MHTQEIVIHCESEHRESILEPQRVSVVTDETLMQTFGLHARQETNSKVRCSFESAHIHEPKYH